MARTEEDIMKGMASPEPAMEPMAEPMPAEPQPEVADSKFNMETVMGNFMDLPQQERKIVGRILATPAPMIFDKILGEPVMQRLAAQLDKPIEVGSEAPSAEGMMAPTAEPMADTPAEDEDSTPPV